MDHWAVSPEDIPCFEQMVKKVQRESMEEKEKEA
jgi:hypothetical protein